MPNCMICKKRAYSGFVLCAHCAKSLEHDSLSPELAFVLDRLAEEIVCNEKIHPCELCKFEDCSFQVSGLVCRDGVKSWLTSKAGEYLAEFSGKERV